MYSTYKVVAFTPAGRERYMSILASYVIFNHKWGMVDEWQIWVNTVNESDIAYMEKLAEKYDFIKLKYGKNIIEKNSEKHMSMYQFFEHITDPDTIYVRLDDDIVYIHPHAIANLVQYRVRNPAHFIVLGNIVNNAVISYIQQKRGVLTRERGSVKYWMHDRLTMFSDHSFTKDVHKVFFQKYKDGKFSDYYFPEWFLNDPDTGMSVNFFAVFGRDLMHTWQEIQGEVPEEWFVVKHPKRTGVRNAICGTALVCHFAFRTQEEFLLNETDILDRYRKIMCKEVPYG